MARLAPLLIALAVAASGQIKLSLEDAGSRRSPDFVPQHKGAPAVVEGVVSAPAIQFPDYAHLPIQDGGYGLIVEGAPGGFKEHRPGARLRVSGVVDARGGLPVIRAQAVESLGAEAQPRPEKLAVSDLQGFRHLGKLVTFEAVVSGKGESSWGPNLFLEGAGETYKIFTPYSERTTPAAFREFRQGDLVRVTGIASQYCVAPPYDHLYQALIDDPAAAVLVSRRPLVSMGTLTGIGAVLALATLVWWSRERRLSAQRRVLRSVQALGEKVLGAESVSDAHKQVHALAPRIFAIRDAGMLVLNRSAKTLDGQEASGQPLSVQTGAPPSGWLAAVQACAENQTMLAAPDLKASPYARPGEPGGALLLAPMFAQGEFQGVLYLRAAVRRHWSEDDRSAAQHLANQTGLALRLLDQRHIREQLFRSEKAAAVGQLLSAVISELEAPLGAIARTAEAAAAPSLPAAAVRDLRTIADEARKSMEIVSRLVSYGAADVSDARPVEINALLRGLVDFRRQEWKTRGVTVQDAIADQPMRVLASPGQIEQLFLTILVHAEQHAAESSLKTVSVRTSQLAGRILVEVGYYSTAEVRGLELCRGIVSNHQGEMRIAARAGGETRIEIELPETAGAARRPRSTEGLAPGQPKTALLVEPDPAVSRQILGLLSARGYRVVPVRSSDEGLELAQRLRFDLVFCSVHAPGLNWVEVSEQMRRRSRCFVLLSDGHDPVLASSFRDDGRFVLPKPIDELALDRILGKAARAAAD